MYAVVVKFRLERGSAAAFLPLVRENAATSLRSEPGCHVFDVATDPDRPEEVLLYEVYENAAAFALHLETAHFAAFDAQCAGLVAEKEVRTYREVTR